MSCAPFVLNAGHSFVSDYLLPRLQAAVRGKLLPLTDCCELVSAVLGLQVGDLGALALVACASDVVVGVNLLISTRQAMLSDATWEAWHPIARVVENRTLNQA